LSKLWCQKSESQDEHKCTKEVFFHGGSPFPQGGPTFTGMIAPGWPIATSCGERCCLLAPG
jgi:hypothetical protein